MIDSIVPNMNIFLYDDIRYGIEVNTSGSFIYPYGDSKMTLKITGQKVSNITNIDLKKFIAAGVILPTAKIEDKYGWAVSGGIYSPMLLDNMLTIGFEAFWIQTIVKDEFKSLHFAYKSTITPKLNSSYIVKGEYIGNIIYDGLKIFGISANARVNLPANNSNIPFYIPASIGVVWSANNENYCKKKL